jgi:hypothetical protein
MRQPVGHLEAPAVRGKGKTSNVASNAAGAVSFDVRRSTFDVFRFLFFLVSLPIFDIFPPCLLNNRKKTARLSTTARK